MSVAGVNLTLSSLLEGKNLNQGGHKFGIALDFEGWEGSSAQLIARCILHARRSLRQWLSAILTRFVLPLDKNVWRWCVVHYYLWYHEIRSFVSFSPSVLRKSWSCRLLSVLVALLSFVCLISRLYLMIIINEELWSQEMFYIVVVKFCFRCIYITFREKF